MNHAKRIIPVFMICIIIMLLPSAIAEEWTCSNCGKTNTGNFRTSCGTKRDIWICPNCGSENNDAFCGNCGEARPVDYTASLLGLWEYKDNNYAQYLAFTEDERLIIYSPYRDVVQGQYKANADQLTVISLNGQEQSYHYKLINDQLYFEALPGNYIHTNMSTNPLLSDIDTESLPSLDVDMILGRTIDTSGSTILSGYISDISWTRSIRIEKNVEKSESGWGLPSGAEQTAAQQEIHHYDSVLDHYENVEVQRSRQVIDHYETYYTYEDNSNGTFTEVSHQRPVYGTEYYTETVQQPVYRQVPKYATKYYYKIKKWEFSRDVTASKNDQNPEWPDYSLDSEERVSYRSESYYFIIKTSLKDYKFRTEQDLWKQLYIEEPLFIKSNSFSTEILLEYSNENSIIPAHLVQ